MTIPSVSLDVNTLSCSSTSYNSNLNNFFNVTLMMGSVCFLIHLTISVKFFLLFISLPVRMTLSNHYNILILSSHTNALL